MIKRPALSRLRTNDFVLLAVVALVLVLGYGVFRTVFSETDSPFGKEIVSVFLGALVTVLVTALLLNRQTELELRKDGDALLFHQRADIYLATIEKVAELVERRVHDEALVDDLRVLNHKLAAVGSLPVIEAFRGVLDRIGDSLSDGRMSGAEAEAVMHAVARLTIAMRAELLGAPMRGLNGADAGAALERAVLTNSRGIERIDDMAAGRDTK